VWAPVVGDPISGGRGEITGDFTEAEVRDLAVVLQTGSLPVELEQSEVQTVSATLGQESLRQGILAGVVGLILLCLYLAFYYRLLGVVTWLGMAIWGLFSLTLVALLGRAVGYSLTLAGVAGVIVSLGIAADSYIVFYERLKDEVRKGKTPRAAVAPAFASAWRTILAANTVTIVAAVILYLLAIGSVRGFAFTLGLATMLDLFVVWFFKRPTVFLIARNRRLSELRGMGLRSGVAQEATPVAGGSR
jgi:preprotein translocase subunit SecD